jgi:hypothetical protein
MKTDPEKSNPEPGQYGPKHIAAGFEKTALIASWGAAIPTPPIARETGPMLIRLSPLVAEAKPVNKSTKRTAKNGEAYLLIDYPPF